MPPASAQDIATLVPRERGEPQAPLSDSERAVLDALRGIAYGQVEVVVHGSRIVQITRSEKLRPSGDAG